MNISVNMNVNVNMNMTPRNDLKVINIYEFEASFELTLE
jgi:hypothetical protein